MIPLFTSEQIRKADNYAIDTLGIPSIALMENAARSIVAEIFDYYPDLSPIDTIGIVVGKGNNGGDGLAVARHLINLGFHVEVLSIGTKAGLKGDALTNYKILEKLIARVEGSKLSICRSVRDFSKLTGCTIIIDALLGTGATGDLKEPYNTMVKKLNTIDSIKVAVDIPTGLDVDTGFGKNIFYSDLTITLAGLKRGLFFGEGYKYSGEVVTGSIGIGDEYFSRRSVYDYLIEPEDAVLGLPIKDISSHKYSAGKVLTIAGCGELPGASFYTADAVLKAGAGASVLAFPKSIKTLAQSKVRGAVVRSYLDNGTEFLQSNNISELSNDIKWADVIAIGPGLGRKIETQTAVMKILKENKNKNFVIDADAIFALGDKKYKKLDLADQILTPHYKEFADLLGISLDELVLDPLKFGKKFSSETKAYLVLKGAPTIIFNPSGEALINSSGNPGMAKFGTGDVLTGVIAGFLAQSPEIEQSVISAVYLHSLSADLLLPQKTEYGITADDICDNLPNAIKFLIDSFV